MSLPASHFHLAGTDSGELQHKRYGPNSDPLEMKVVTSNSYVRMQAPSQANRHECRLCFGSSFHLMSR